MMCVRSRGRIGLHWLLLGLTLCGACENGGEGPAGAETGPALSKAVKAAEVNAEPLRSGTEILGTLRARLSVEVATELGGSVERLHFDRGERVAEGDVLAEIGTKSIELEVRQAEAAVAVARSEYDKTESGSRPEEISIARAGLDQAMARLREARRHFDRIRGLFEQKAVSDSELDAASRGLEAAEADVASARERLELARKGPRTEDRTTARARWTQALAALEVARDRLRKSRVRAPCAGVASFRRVEVGEVVSPGHPITRITDTTRMKVRASVPERDLPLLEQGGTYRFTVDALKDASFPGRLVFVSPTADPGTRSYPVELLAEEHDPRMADGMTVRLFLPLREPRMRVLVPSAWLSEADGRIGLYVVEEGRARFRSVALGDYYERRVEITEGLEPGEIVITAPAGLRDGDPVRVERSQ
jgi:multidrug efflux pump subunit AcrA (membrane-fusion protein)